MAVTFRSLLPAVAFFGLLGAAAGIGYWFGTQAATGGGAEAEKVYTCSMHPQVRKDGPGLCPICHMELVPLDSIAQDEGPALTIDPVVVQNMGVRVATATAGPLVRTVRAFGVLREAQSRQRDIALKVSGFVERLFADTEGMVIQQGDPLFELYSAELVVAQEELIAARRSGDAELLTAARQKLLLWDVPAATVDELQELDRARRTLVWRSPFAGTLTRRDVVQGAPAMMNQTLLRIVDLSELWLDAQVAEQQLPALRLGQTARATFPALPGAELAGEVIFVSPTLDEQTRTATVRVTVPNAERQLRPGMFARLQLPVALGDDAVQVPAEAVIDTGMRQVAWLALGNGRFEPREVRTGPVGDDGLLQVLSGIAAGDRVVVSGQFLIDAESRLREGTRKMGHHGLMPEGRHLPLRDPIPLSAAQQERVDALLRAYLDVAADLAAERDDAARWQTLRDAAAALHDDAPDALHTDLHALQQALAADAGDPAARRQALIPASRSLIGLFEVARPGPAFGPELHVIHCPMVPADWLQLGPEVENFFDRSMPHCGEATGRIPLQGAEAGR